MTVTVTESLTLGGYAQGGTNSITIDNIAEVNRRIVNVPITEVIIVSISTAVAAGTFVESDVMYIRITNKDDTNHVGLIFRNEDNDEFGVKLDHGQSFIYNGDLSGGVVDTMDSAATSLTANTFADLVDITAIADTDPVDLEVFVASK
jgi:hypothetical protein